MNADWFALAAMTAAFAALAGFYRWASKPIDPRGGWPTWDKPKAAPPARPDHAGTTGGEWRAACADFDDALADIQTELTEAIAQARGRLEEAKAELEEARRDIEEHEGAGTRLYPATYDLLGEKVLREKEEEIATLREEIERLRAEKGYR